MPDQIRHIEANLERLSRRVPETPVQEVLLARMLVLLGRDLSAMLDQKLRPHGLNEVEFRTLMAVFSRGEQPTYPSDLCAGLAQSPANITRISDALLERGLITRIPCELDRRRLALRVTARGETLANALMPTLFASLGDIFTDFSAAEKAALVTSLKRLAEAIARSERDLEQA